MRILLAILICLATPLWGASDSFTNTTGTALDTHDSNWDDLTGTYPVSNCSIQGNTVQSTAWGNCGAIYSASSSDTSQIVFGPFTDIQVKKGPCVRAGSGSHGYCVHVFDASGGNWHNCFISKNDAEWQYCGAMSYSQASNHTLKIVASGTSTTNIKVYIDETLEFDGDDASSPITSGKPGFRIYPNGTIADTALDDWTDGSGGGGGGGSTSGIIFTPGNGSVSVQ